MEKPGYSQLELFSQNAQREPALRKNTNFFRYLRAYEKTIVLIIAFVASGVISYSLGVEKGKQAVSPKPLAQKGIPRAVKPPVDSLETKPQALHPLSEKTYVREFGNYTIQLASYQTRSSAQKEIETLKKKGLAAITLAKGKYIILCVGKFPNYNSAKTKLAEFQKQKRYQGCIIRRL